MEELRGAGCWGAVGPPTALQKPAGMDGGRARRGGRPESCGEFRMWCGGFRGDGRRLFEDFHGGSGSSGLGFTVDCHLIETVNANCFLNARDKK